MITSVISSPTIWSPAYNPIIWMVDSDQVGQFKFKYVFDVFIAGATAGIRYKVPPNPSGVGIIDVSSIVQTELTINENLPMLSAYPFYLGTGMATEVYILAGEEYSLTATGTPIIYDGFGFVGEPRYGLYADGDFAPAPNYISPVVVYAAAQSPIDYYDYRSTGGETIQDYTMTSTTSKFLTLCPNNPQDIRSDEDFTLSWINWDLYAATGPRAVPYAMKATLKLSGATAGTEVYYNTLGEGGGSWTTNTSFPERSAATGPSDPKFYLNNFKFNPIDIVTPAFDSVTLQLFSYETYGATGLGATGISEPINLTINDDNCWGFEPIRFTWLNSLGGRDWYTFIKRNTNTQNANRQTFYQLPGYWSGSSFPVTDISPARYGTTVYNVQLQNSWTASTDWITPEESEWLRSMFASPSVHAYLPGRSQPTLVTITDGSYETQSYARQKLFQYFVSFVEAQSDTVQGY